MEDELAPDGDPRNIGTLLVTPHDVLESTIIDEIARRGFVGIGVAQARVFENLVVGGPATLTVLAGRVGVTKQALAHTVTRMVELGYLDDSPHPHDGRSRLIAISERGMAVVGVATDVITTLQQRWSAGLGAQEWATLRRLLLRLNAIVA